MSATLLKHNRKFTPEIYSATTITVRANHPCNHSAVGLEWHAEIITSGLDSMEETITHSRIVLQLSYSTELKACLPLWYSREQGNETLEDGQDLKQDTFYRWVMGAAAGETTS